MFTPVIDQVSLLWKLRKKRSRNFEPHVRIEMDTSRFLIKTADSLKELNKVFKLRSQVFLKELLNRKICSPIDIDSYDIDSDHLIIIEKSTQNVVGTYRLRSTLFTDTFYSESEFNIQQLLKLPGTKLELGRACIAKDYRKGTVIHLIWKGISEYLAQTKSEYLFGCASLRVKPLEYQKIFYKLECENSFNYQTSVTPYEKYKPENYGFFQPWDGYQLTEEDISKIELPPLFSFYLKAGSRVLLSPAYDNEFKCIDFITLLNLTELNKSLSRKYQK